MEGDRIKAAPRVPTYHAPQQPYCIAWEKSVAYETSCLDFLFQRYQEVSGSTATPLMAFGTGIVNHGVLGMVDLMAGDPDWILRRRQLP